MTSTIFNSPTRCFNRAFFFWNTDFSHVTNDVVRETRVDRSDLFIGPNFLAVDNERIFLAELRSHMLERLSHSVLILLVNEIHKGRVFISITGRRIEGSAIAANFDMPRAIWTFGDEIRRIAQQF